MFGLERWKPTRQARPYFGEFDDLVSRLFNEPFMNSMGANNWTPSSDLMETENEIRIVCDLPGMKKEDLDIQLTSNTIVIRGERKFEEESNTQYHRMERFYGSFARTYTLPATVDADKISASFKDGVLEVVIPKSESAKARKIAVKD